MMPDLERAGGLYGESLTGFGSPWGNIEMAICSYSTPLFSEGSAARGRSHSRVGSPRHLACKSLIHIVGQIPDLPTSRLARLLPQAPSLLSLK